MGTPGFTSADDFQALEQKVLRAVDVLRHEREARAAAESKLEQLEQRLTQQTDAANSAQAQVSALEHERDQVRQRVERMLQQMDELL